MGTITIPGGGGDVTTRDPGMSEKKPRELSGLDKAGPAPKASPVFDVKEGGGDNGRAGGGGGWGGSNSSSDSNPAGPSGTGLW